MEAIGYPRWVQRPEDEGRYIQYFRDSEGIELDKAAIKKNAAKMGLAKLSQPLARRPVQSAVQWSRVNYYKPTAPVYQPGLEFVITGDAERYLDLDIHFSVRRKLVEQDGSALDLADTTSVVKNLLQSLFSQWSVTLNGVSVSSSKDL